MTNTKPVPSSLKKAGVFWEFAYLNVTNEDIEIAQQKTAGSVNTEAIKQNLRAKLMGVV
ncbi:MAG: hypothetical protein ACK5KL_16290 [Dysgonomonas sp.]